MGWNVDNRDVCEVDFTGMQAEVIQAGFPCQAFSYAGKSRGFEDTRGTLFFEFARAIRDVRPKVAIGENVRGLVKHDGGRTLATMLETLDQLGYRVRYRVLRSQYLDVPQKRERLIMFAVRRDLDLPFIFPRERDYCDHPARGAARLPREPGAGVSGEEAPRDGAGAGGRVLARPAGSGAEGVHGRAAIT